MPSDRPTASSSERFSAIRFVMVMGLLSLFADASYESARGIVGAYLAQLGAAAAVVAVATGGGELLGNLLRYGSGALGDRTGRYWLLTGLGYSAGLLAVPAMGLAGSWPAVVALVFVERFGKGLRAPARDVLLSRAAELAGPGKAFGIHEALDQIGAIAGPLAVGAILASGRSYAQALRWLAIPTLAALALLGAARYLYPTPHVSVSARRRRRRRPSGLPGDQEVSSADRLGESTADAPEGYGSAGETPPPAQPAVPSPVSDGAVPLRPIPPDAAPSGPVPDAAIPSGPAEGPARLPGSASPTTFRLYVLGVSLAAAGLADFALVAFHAERLSLLRPSLIPVVFAAAMAADAVSALGFGSMFDKFGLSVLSVATAMGSIYAAFAFSSSAALLFLGALLWGISLGAQESVMRSAVVSLVPLSRRGRSYGVVGMWYGLAWFAGSATLGFLYGIGRGALATFSIACELAAATVFLIVRNRARKELSRPGATSSLT
jgi:MFS family permease